MKKCSDIGIMLMLLALISVPVCFADISEKFFNIYSAHYSTRHGLPSNYIRYINQDTQGRIWICSQRGVASFDGREFVQYSCTHCSDESIDYNVLKQDSKGTIWVGTNRGASYINGKKIVHLPIDWDGEPPVISDIEEDQKKRIWALCDSEYLCRLDDRSQEKPEWENPPEKLQITQMRRAENGNLWLSTETGFYVMSDGIVARRELNMELSILDFVMDDVSSGWCVDNTGFLYRFKDDQFIKVKDLTDAVSRSIYDMEVCHSGGLWIATLRGLYLWQNDQLKHFRYQNGLTSSVIMDVFLDREENLWYGSDNGLGKIPGLMFRCLMPTPDFPISSVTGICQDTFDRYWFASNEGLIRVDGGEIKIWRADDGLHDDSIYAVVAFGNGVAFTNPFGLFFVGSNEKIQQFADDSFGPFLSLLSHEEIIWLTSKEGLFKYSITTGMVDVNNEFPFERNISVSSVFFDSRNWMWITTDGDGVYVTQDGNLKNVESVENMPSQRAFTIDEDKWGSIWVGTLGGLCCLEGTSIKQVFGLKQGLVSEDIWTVLCARNDGVWISTSKGLSSIYAGRVLNYDYYDGLSGEDFVSNCRYLDKKNSLWFGGMGISIVDPSEEKPVRKPLTSFRFVMVNGEPLVDGQKIPAGRNTFEFGLMCSSFRSEIQNRFRYQLMGYDEFRSAPTNASEIRYTNLPRGNYTLLAESCNRDGQWSANPTTLNFEILPAWWQREIIWILEFLILILIIRFVIRVRSYQLAKTTARLQEEVRRQTRVIQKQMERLEEQKNLMEHQAKTDDLTRLYNRRHFYHKLRDAWIMRRIEGMALSIVIFDLDHFKVVNDTFGHLTGDIVLRKVSSEIQNIVPHSGIAARFGGEEIILMLESIDLDGAYSIAEKIRIAVENLDIECQEDPDFKVTISGGVACRSGLDSADTPDALIKEADEALYRAKADGRNRICKAE
ncbi:diguanylate cyclase [bacterium]|nr:diguanylate cyclase [bacterium]